MRTRIETIPVKSDQVEPVSRVYEKSLTGLGVPLNKPEGSRGH